VCIVGASGKLGRWLGRLICMLDIDDQVEASQRVLASDTWGCVIVMLAEGKHPAH